MYEKQSTVLSNTLKFFSMPAHTFPPLNVLYHTEIYFWQFLSLICKVRSVCKSTKSKSPHKLGRLREKTRWISAAESTHKHSEYLRNWNTILLRALSTWLTPGGVLNRSTWWRSGLDPPEQETIQRLACVKTEMIFLVYNKRTYSTLSIWANIICCVRVGLSFWTLHWEEHSYLYRTTFMKSRTGLQWAEGNISSLHES
jgi:hypothetical protein